MPNKVTHAEVRMYRLGTGDCFAIKLFAGAEVTCKILIDAGCWSGDKARLEKYISDLKTYLGTSIDILIITHEHKDHVHAFDVCSDMFTDADFKVDEIWMGWTENDRVKKVKEWKEEHGEKKKALGIASIKLNEAMTSEDYKKQFTGNEYAAKMMSARQTFTKVLNDFAELHMAFDKDDKGMKVYKGPLAGLDVVKKDITKKDIKYFKPGDVIRDVGSAEGVRIFVLGPPELYDDVKKEAGGQGESYQHNNVLRESEAFGAAILNLENKGALPEDLLPFDESFLEPASDRIFDNPQTDEEKALKKESEQIKKIIEQYGVNDWQKIDFDWMFSAGAFALRMNGLTNNLSLALAFEFEDSGRVMLFPGDAEFGSWASWHNIQWNDDDRRPEDKDKDKKDLKHFTEDLLNRTVFYKVAHHLSHNGTAKRLGLEMMKHKDLVAMATLDYNVINDGWTSTMPNRALIKELLLRTKGRLIIMNEDKLFFDFNEQVPITQKIAEARNRMTDKERKHFDENFDSTNPLYFQYTVKA